MTIIGWYILNMFINKQVHNIVVDYSAVFGY